MVLARSIFITSRTGSLKTPHSRAISGLAHSLNAGYMASSSPLILYHGPRYSNGLGGYRAVIHSRNFWKPSNPFASPGKSPNPGVTPTSAVNAPDASGVVELPETPSTAAAQPAEILDVAAESSDVAETTSIIADTSTSIVNIPPLELGDFSALGLVSYTPAGIIRWSFEVLNVATGMPWFWTIVAGSLLWRAVLTPFVIMNLQNTARLMPLQPKLIELREEMRRANGDRLAMQRVALKQKKLYSDAGVGIGRAAITPFIQLPVALGLFFGVRKMCNLPVEQLKHSGLDILPDLTVADPYGVLPWAFMLLVNLQISAGARDLNLKERPEMGHMMNGLRILTLLGVYVMGDFPSGLMVSLLVTSGVTTLQTLLLQHSSIRQALNIPIIPHEMRGRLPSFRETYLFVIDSWKKKLAEAQRAQQQQLKQKR